jgi:hypothetical protein
MRTLLIPRTAALGGGARRNGSEVEPDTLLRRRLIPRAEQRDCHGRA